jgi:hypothetical protein
LTVLITLASSAPVDSTFDKADDVRYEVPTKIGGSPCLHVVLLKTFNLTGSKHDPLALLDKLNELGVVCSASIEVEPKCVDSYVAGHSMSDDHMCVRATLTRRHGRGARLARQIQRPVLVLEEDVLIHDAKVLTQAVRQVPTVHVHCTCVPCNWA